MNVNLTREQISEAVNEEYGNDGDALFDLINESTSTYEPIVDVFLRLAKQLKAADRLSDEVYKAINCHFS